MGGTQMLEIPSLGVLTIKTTVIELRIVKPLISFSKGYLAEYIKGAKNAKKDDDDDDDDDNDKEPGKRHTNILITNIIDAIHASTSRDAITKKYD